MKKEVSNRLFIICFVAAITTFLSCVKEADLPTVVTDDVIDIETISATFNGLVINDGGAKIDLEGFCFGTAHNPTIDNSAVHYGRGDPGNFTKTVPSLVPDTYYHVRAFAMNSEGTAYGNEVHFRTKPVFLATLVPIGPYQITIFSALAGSTNGSSKRPVRNFDLRMRAAARFTYVSDSFPSFTWAASVR